MRLIKNTEKKAIGIWRDSQGNERCIRFYNDWFEYKFSDKELEDLLEGHSISYTDSRKKEVIGHLQCIKGRYYGFCPKESSSYIEFPEFNENIETKFYHDLLKEHYMHEFMDSKYYSKLKNSDGTAVDIKHIKDEETQKQGIDVQYIRDGESYLIDEKAKLDYFNKKVQKETFTLELLNSASGNIGWFLNDALKTNHYMFIWPHGSKELEKVDDIEHADYALVKVETLKNMIKQRCGDEKRLETYAKKIANSVLAVQDLKGSYENDNKRYYKCAPFDNDVYLVYTMAPKDGADGKKERPVNLVVRKYILESLADEKGTLR